MTTTNDTARHRDWLDRQTAGYQNAKNDIIDKLADIWGYDTARRYVNEKLSGASLTRLASLEASVDKMNGSL